MRARAWEVWISTVNQLDKLKVVSGFGEGGVEMHYFVDARDFQGFLDHAFCAGNLEASRVVKELERLEMAWLRI